MKGKKGTKGQQQIYQENKEALRFYMAMCVASHVAYAALMLFVFRGSYNKLAGTMELVCFGLQLLAYAFMRLIARPAFTNGQLMDGGIDLAMENGMGEHSKDIIIWTTVTLLLSVIHRYFWLSLCLIPVRLLYGVWTSFLQPWFFARAPSGDEDDEARQKAEKKQRKAERPKMIVRR